MLHRPLISLCTVMFPAAAEGEIDAVIFSNGFLSIPAAGTPPGETPRERYGVKVQEVWYRIIRKHPEETRGFWVPLVMKFMF